MCKSSNSKTVAAGGGALGEGPREPGRGAQGGRGHACTAAECPQPHHVTGSEERSRARAPSPAWYPTEMPAPRPFPQGGGEVSSGGGGPPGGKRTLGGPPAPAAEGLSAESGSGSLFL